MCDIVTVALDISKQVAIQAFRSEGFDVSGNDNRSLAALFGPGKAAFDITTEGCSCAFYLDSEEIDLDLDRLRRKYQKKGWSEAKIGRALQQMQHAPRLIDRRRLRTGFVKAVEALLLEAGRIQLFSHFYRDPTMDDLEAFKDRGHQSISLGELRIEPGSFPRDIVLSVSSKE